MLGAFYLLFIPLAGLDADSLCFFSIVADFG
jgi:hypothetical protein